MACQNPQLRLQVEEAGRRVEGDIVSATLGIVASKTSRGGVQTAAGDQRCLRGSTESGPGKHLGGLRIR
ncbi:hypothetical protein Q9L58_001297 [Maublancomyces gigas]|uniref:Uncharacterized protein n=1 Tax=Discina gigas TaxID=1032678 RepID=A0ABR3GVA7_9PEZI